MKQAYRVPSDLHFAPLVIVRLVEAVGGDERASLDRRRGGIVRVLAAIQRVQVDVVRLL